MSADFLDTNVVVYQFDSGAPKKQAIACELVERVLAADAGGISWQVVQETLNVLLRGAATPAGPVDALRILDEMLMPLCRVLPSAELYAEALRLKSRWQLSFYDALIVAAAMKSSSTRLLTEDLQHGQDIEGLRIVNPFV